MLNQKGFTLIELIFILAFTFLTVGQIMCIYRFCKCDFEPSYKAEIIYARFHNGGGYQLLRTR
jgi:hypothetical protein